MQKSIKAGSHLGLSTFKQRDHFFARFENFGAKIDNPFLIEGLSHCFGARKQNITIYYNTLLSAILVTWTGIAFFHASVIFWKVPVTLSKSIIKQKSKKVK